MDYEEKYIKYKHKYLSLKYRKNGGSLNKNFILVDGTSSSGKTVICNFLSSKNYKCITIDGYSDKIDQQYFKYLKNRPNEYLSKELVKQMRDKIMAKTAVQYAIDSGKAIIDFVIQEPFIKEFESRGLRSELFIIVVYTNFQNLTRNLRSRLMENDPRGVFVFTQFSKRYITTEKTDLNKIDKINRSKFKQILLDNFKSEFENEEELVKFSNDTFAQMNINDDKNHWIKLRDGLVYDYLLNTTDKSKNEIYEELNTVFN